MSVYTCTCIFLAVGYKFVLSQYKYKGEKNSLNGKWEDTLKSQDVSQEISLHCYFLKTLSA